MTDDRYRDWDAAYVLGSLPNDERLEYERHLETCAACRAAVAELAGVPGLLGRLPAEDAVAIADPDGRPDPAPERTLASVAHRVQGRRRRRRALVAVTAGLAVVAAVLGGVAVGGARVEPAAPTASALAGGASPAPAGGASERYAMTSGSATGLRVDLDVTGKAWGTRFDWGCTYGGRDWGSDSAVMYDLVVVRKDGTDETVASWTASGREAAGLAAATDVPLHSIASVEVRLHDDPRALASVAL
ncbi:putative zinc finger protein [Curtobacterium sp. PhB130]|uniref:anti-sigma factor family protein n=1 Tax=unclassified Curtobacterium TaxID=257496 RepID=UPI000F4B076D|nr:MULTISPECIES: zf-HC2 domain-containing protein [unclassified Curtobacterium]ROP63624.1 putative zinc finger protein [Curtobacterium sp. ZW137]ROS77883.1 putative zinc finger protein [Curtobacterium sp. PhB130]TCK65901.1 putative zinc finger protein [Curtobacterium sp. PhB136]